MRHRFRRFFSTDASREEPCMFDNGIVRKIVLLVVLAGAWEAYARWLSNPLLFPTFMDTVSALFSSIGSGQMPRAVAFTITLLLKGYLAGLVLAGLFTAFATASR